MQLGETLGGEDLKRMIAAAAIVIEQNAEVLNTLNVFPVPDGDTGINMLLTLRATIEEADRCSDSGVGAVASAVAHGALMGGRGNAGIILGEFFRGVARALNGKAVADASDIGQAFQETVPGVYRAVSRPVEGTMLTVIREAADVAVNASSEPGANVLTVIQAALDEAYASVGRTPDLLPELREAGVVDAGGLGFALVLAGMAGHLAEQDLAEIRTDTLPVDLGHIKMPYLASVEEEAYGYCTQFFIEGEGMDPDAIRSHLAAISDSVVVVGDESTVQVHLHAEDPGQSISYGITQGEIGGVQITNMERQHLEFATGHREALELAPFGVLAVARGEGIRKVFRSIGATVMRGGQTMNPSTQDVLRGIDRTPAEAVILLPNNPNIIPVARQAVKVASKTLHVVLTESIPQGVAAALAFSAERSLKENLDAMEEARNAVRTGEITAAIRATAVEGVEIKAGQIMALLDDKLVAVADTPVAALDALVEGAAATSEISLITLYWGSELNEEEARQVAGHLERRFPEFEVEAVFGGQPYYHYILGIE